MAAARLIRHFLCTPETAEFGPYTPINDEPIEPEELIKGRMYRLRMVDADEKSVDIQLFLEIGEIGGLLWEQDVRALLRIAGSPHPALPEVLDGGYVTAKATATAGVPGGMAFVATRGSRRCAGPEDVKYFRDHRAEAFRQFRSLAEGLAELHYLGISHRDLSPRSIDVYAGSMMRLARFELSALVTDLFRVTVDSASDVNVLRELFTHQANGLAYAPPERVGFLLGGDSNLVENDRSDVFSLAAVVWEWFVGPFPADQLPETVGGESLDLNTVERIRSAHESFARYLRRTVVEASEVPAELAAILARMLDPDPDQRPSSDEVLGLLASGYDRIMTDLEGPVAARPHVIIFMPQESAETMYRRGMLNHNPVTSEGRTELSEFILTDLRGAYMAHSPHGADPFVRGGDLEAKRSATQVLRGEQVAWFCEYYRPRDEHGSLGLPSDKALIIKFAVQLSITSVEKKLRELAWKSARLVPELDVRAMDIDAEVLARRMARAPSWRDLIDSTRPVSTDSPEELAYQEAIDWLMEYQDVELAARAYPYIRMEGMEDIERSQALIRYDPERDQRRIVNSTLFIKYAASPALRPEFGSFFGGLENEDGDSEVDILEDRNGRPGRHRLTTAKVVRKEGQDRVLLSSKRGENAVPEQGWIVPADDSGSQASLDRQRDASYELFKAKHLQSYLHRPRTIRTLAHHWKDVGADLKGDAREVVQEILVCEPFFAIQGPPGTGKTRVAATALAAYLERDPTARVLVSAQSNFALDNLAARVLKEIGAMDSRGRPVQSEHDKLRPLALRVTTRGVGASGRVDKAIQPWRRFDAALRQSRYIHTYVEGLLKDENARLGSLRPVLADWSRLVSGQEESVVPELSDRLHRGANLVFATCASSTPELLSPTANAVFNWVLVEEAAKAWPTELAIPLLRGLRWTLIGDHFQLPAHRRDDLVRFLKACAADPNEQMAHITSDKVEQYLKVFDMFGQLFKDEIDPKQPLRRLSVQFRMREPLGDLVSRVFYPAKIQPKETPADGLPVGGVATYIDPDPAKRIAPVQFATPRFLNNESLVWLDTDGISSCLNQPHWWNPGEATLVVELVGQLAPFPKTNQNGYSESPLAVLTPYREQLKLLQGSSVVAPYLSTIHAFQGREADIVIVSLVRDKAYGGGRGPAAVQAGLGHVSQRQLVNVMFSRARRQLVIIGRFDHYARIMGPDGFWTQVCRAVELRGKKLSAYDLFGNVSAMVAPREPLDVSRANESGALR
jgi:hypothetical protein